MSLAVHHRIRLKGRHATKRAAILIPFPSHRYQNRLTGPKSMFRSIWKKAIKKQTTVPSTTIAALYKFNVSTECCRPLRCKN